MSMQDLKTFAKFRHGGAYDRGAADCFYDRKFEAHYYAGGTYQTPRILVEEGSEEYAQYAAGYADQAKFDAPADMIAENR